MMEILAKGKVVAFIVFVAFWAAVLVYIKLVEKGHEVEIRRLAPLDAIDEAIGRAVEMGQPVMVNPGLGSLSGTAAAETVAGLAVLGYCSSKVAAYDSKLIVPISQPDVMPLASDIVRQSYLAAGRPEKFKAEEQIRFLSPDQFAWTVGIQGLAEREKPAANIMIGSFAAEAMILAETLARVGALQVGGLTNTFQIPFFVAACDFVLIGEEIFAAGAYLSKDAKSIGSIAGEDLLKIVAIITIVVGVVLTMLGVKGIPALLQM